jgi:hypothetical protein
MLSPRGSSPARTRILANPALQPAEVHPAWRIVWSRTTFARDSGIGLTVVDDLTDARGGRSRCPRRGEAVSYSGRIARDVADQDPRAGSGLARSIP